MLNSVTNRAVAAAIKRDFGKDGNNGTDCSLSLAPAANQIAHQSKRAQQRIRPGEPSKGGKGDPVRHARRDGYPHERADFVRPPALQPEDEEAVRARVTLGVKEPFVYFHGEFSGFRIAFYEPFYFRWRGNPDHIAGQAQPQKQHALAPLLDRQFVDSVPVRI